MIERLRGTRVDERHREWLTALPKAELHCHLGGVLDIPERVVVGQSVWNELPPAARDAAWKRVRSLDWGDPWAWRAGLAEGDRAATVACVLAHTGEAELSRRLYAATEPRVALRDHPLGFLAYEVPGELSGSAILSHPAAIEPYARAVLDRCQRDGIAYLEVRGSPQKYRPADPKRWLSDWLAALDRARAGVPEPRPWVGFVVIADRRRADTVRDVVLTAVESSSEIGDRVLGLDLAGDEAVGDYGQLAECFRPAFEACLNLTVHAGEGETAESIWSAAYTLNADRVGHGLSLAERPELMRRFRDRRICLEVCPTSNREVVGCRDPAFPESEGFPVYPLRTLIENGVPLTLCTDNPGISRTTLAGEYLAAARMAEGGLTLWEALALVRQGFLHAFAPAAVLESLVPRIDAEVVRLVATCPVD